MNKTAVNIESRNEIRGADFRCPTKDWGVSNVKSLAILGAAAALSFLAAGPAAYAGSKTINNNTSDTIKVVVTERGTDCSSNAGKAHVTVPANSSGTLNYSTTNINSMEVSLTDSSSSSTQKATFTCTATGGSGTLDNAFNSNSIFEIGQANFGITFSSHN